MGADTEANTMTTGERLAEGQQIIKGDSGGLVEDKNGEFVGIITAHGTDDPSKTLFTPASFVATLAQSCNGPQCRPIIIRRRVEQPMFGIGIPMGPPRSVDIAQPMPRPPQVYVPQPRPNPISTPPAQPQISADQIRQIVADYLQQNPPPAGRDGQPGADGSPGRDAEVNYEAIISAVVSQLPPPAKGDPGPPGERGPQGERGLVGVPDDEDIRNWLVGAMSDPRTKQQLAAMLADLVSADPRVDQLISRLEAVENRKHSQRVLLVDGSKGNVIDDETYVDEPIVLDVRKFRGPSQ
jgi:hypothetical protein